MDNAIITTCFTGLTGAIALLYKNQYDLQKKNQEQYQELINRIMEESKDRENKLISALNSFDDMREDIKYIKERNGGSD